MDTGCVTKLVNLIALKITQCLLARPASNLQLLTDIIREFWGTNLYIWLQLIQCTIWGQLIKDTKFVIASHAHTITIPV